MLLCVWVSGREEEEEAVHSTKQSWLNQIWVATHQGVCVHGGHQVYVYMEDIRCMCTWRTSGVCVHGGHQVYVYMEDIRCVCTWRTSGVCAHGGHQVYVYMEDIRCMCTWRTSGVYVYSVDN